ncbi:MAG: 16S rRNA (uracil(1498)-N(3))-methyltransferase [Clostridia bacterium]|nr:16S rRNA (uracil(1498)-N(3))-methyltransferase [Clostridia bacterium]
MKRFYLTENQIKNNIIDGDEYNHIKNVMRMKSGDRFIAIGDPDGYDLIFELGDLGKSSATLKFIERQENKSNPKLNIMVVQALAKGDKLDTVTEKATELGASAICPIYLKNCDVKEGSGKLARLSRIAISATKQCGRSKPLQVYECVNLKNITALLNSYELIILANEKEDNKPLIEVLNENKTAKSIAIIIGPEGGFTSEEIETIIALGGKSVTLGRRILRTETAGLYMLSVINEIFDN